MARFSRRLWDRRVEGALQGTRERGASGETRALIKRRITVFFWVVGIAVYTGVVFYVGWREILAALSTARPAPVFFMTLITVAALWLRVFKWRLALGRGCKSVGLFWLSKAAGEFSPGRVGELSPLLLRRYRNARVGAWIVIDRLLETIVTLALGVLGVLLISTSSRTAVLLLSAALIASLLLALHALTRHTFFAYLARHFSSTSRWHRVFELLAAVSSEARGFRARWMSATVLTGVAGCMDVWAGMLLYDAFSWSVSFQLMAAAKGVHAITSAIPVTPNATGVPYVTTAVLIHEAGGVPAHVLASAIALAVAITNTVFWISAAFAAMSLGRDPDPSVPARFE